MTALHAALTQAPAVSPALVSTVALLALPRAELEQRTRELLATNPALDVGPGACPVCGAPGPRPTCGCGRPQPPARHPAGPADFTALGAQVDELSELESAAASLLSAAERPLLAYVMADLDSRGYLDRTPEQLAHDVGAAPSQVRQVIEAIRAVGPPGICARDLVDALLLQLDTAPDPPPVLRPLIEHHLAAVGAGRLDSVARRLAVPLPEVRTALAYLRSHLRPCPAIDRGGPPPIPLRPDLVFVVSEDAARVEVLLPAEPQLRLHPRFAALAQDRQRLGQLPDAERDMVTRALADAVDLLSRLGRREAMLHHVGVEVAHHQDAFLRRGAAAPAPLTRADVAAALGVHESTVSRAVAGKVAALPDNRAVLLAELFGGSRSAQESLRVLIAAEDSPRSDAELARALADLGHPVSRSAVRKYRTQLGIPAQQLR